MYMRIWAALAALSIFDIVAGDNYFINPPDFGNVNDMSSNPIYKVGQQINVEWVTTYNAVNVYLWQVSSTDKWKLLKSKFTSSKFTWVVNATTFNLGGYNSTSKMANNIFYIIAYDVENGANGITSHYFNITDPASSTTTSRPTSTATQTATTKGATAATTTTGATVTQDAQADNSSDASNSGALTSAEKTGLGVGLGIGIPMIAAIAGGIFWYLRRKRGITYHPVSAVEGNGPSGGAGLFGGNTPFAGAAGFYKSPEAFGTPGSQAADSKVLYGAASPGMGMMPTYAGSPQPITVSELDSTPRPAEPVEMPASEVTRLPGHSRA